MVKEDIFVGEGLRFQTSYDPNSGIQYIFDEANAIKIADELDNRNKEISNLSEDKLKLTIKNEQLKQENLELLKEDKISKDVLLMIINNRIQSLPKRYKQSNTYYAGLNELKNLRKDILRWMEEVV